MENGHDYSGRGVCFSTPETVLAFQACAPRLRCVPGYVSSRFPDWVRNTVIKTFRSDARYLEGLASINGGLEDSDCALELFLSKVNWKELEDAL